MLGLFWAAGSLAWAAAEPPPAELAESDLAEAPELAGTESTLEGIALEEESPSPLAEETLEDLAPLLDNLLSEDLAEIPPLENGETNGVALLETYSGKCGDNLTWNLDKETGVLTISGTGAMYDYEYWNNKAPWYNHESPWYDYNFPIKKVKIAEGVTSIGAYAFFARASLTNLTLPKTLTSIGYSAFYGCKLTSITLPEGLTSIGAYAFDGGCESLTILTLPKTLTSIDAAAFWGCESLTSLTLPEGLTSIGGYAFYNCSSLTSLTLPKTLTSIGVSAFYDCKLTSLTLQEGLTSIGDHAFGDCESLSSAYFKGDAPTSFGSSVFDYTADYFTIYYEAGKAGWTTPYWNGYRVMPYDAIPVTGVRLNLEGLLLYKGEQENLIASVAPSNATNKEVTWSSSDPSVVTVDSWGKVTAVGIGEAVIKVVTEDRGFSDICYVTVTDWIIPVTSVSLDQTELFLEKDGQESLIATITPSDATNKEVIWSSDDYSVATVTKQGKVIAVGEGETTIKVVTLDGQFSATCQVTVGFPLKFISFGRPISNIPGAGIPAIGEGLNFDLNIPGCPIEFSVDGDTAVGVIGIDMFKYTSSKSNINGRWRQGKTKIENNMVKDVAEIIKNDFKEMLAIYNPENLKNKFQEIQGKFGEYTKQSVTRFGVKASSSFIGYIECKKNKNGWYVSDGGGIFLGNAGANLSGQFPFPPFPAVPCYWSVYLKGALEAKLALMAKKLETDFLNPTGTLSGKITLGGELGFGINNAASVGGGIEGYLIPNLTLDQYSNVFTLEAQAAAFVRGVFIFWEGKHSWPSKKVRLYPDNESEIDTLEAVEFLSDLENYQLVDRSYAQNESSFLNQADSEVSPLVGSTEKTESIFQTNVYTYANTQLLKLSNGNQLLVWVDDDRNRSDINRTSLFYSYYNGSWSKPQAVYNDGTADFAPLLKQIGSKVFLTWQNSKEVLPDDTAMEASFASMEIAVMEYDFTNNSFTNFAQLSNNSTLDMLPHLAGNDSEVKVVWINNPENELWGQNPVNQFQQSIYQDNKWSTAETLLADLGSIDAFDLTHNGSEYLLAYSMDTNNNIQDFQDKEIFLLKDSGSTKLTNDQVLDSKPSFDNQNNLYWFSNGSIKTISDWESREVSNLLPTETILGTDRFQVLNDGQGNLAVVFTTQSGLRSEIGGYLYDQQMGAWSEKMELTEMEDYYSNLSGYTTGYGEVSLAFTKQAVIGEIGDEEPYGQTDLNLLSTGSPSYNLTISEDLYADTNYLVAGNALEILTTVKNIGEFTANAFDLEVLDGEGNLLQSTEIRENLVPNAEKLFKAIYTVPENSVPGTFTVRIVPVGFEDADLSNNSRKIVLNYIDLAIKNLSYEEIVDGKVKITSEVTNYGMNVSPPTSLQWLENNEAGKLLEESSVPALESLESVKIEYVLKKDLAKNQAIFLSLLPLENESFIANNTDLLNLINQEDGSSGTFKGVSLGLQSELSVNFQVNKNWFTGQELGQAGVQFNDQEELARDLAQDNGNNYSFNYRGLAAKEMGDPIEAVLFRIGSDGIKQFSQVLNYSVADYLTKVLSSDDYSQDLKTFLVDLANYGTAAQNYFNYNTANPLNVAVKDYQFLSSGTIQFTDEDFAYKVTSTGKAIKDFELALKLENRIEAALRVKDSGGYAVEDLILQVEYYDLNGDLQIWQMDGAKQDFISQAVIFNKLSAEQMDDVFRISVLDRSGETVSETATYSITSYAVWIDQNLEDEQLKELTNKMVQMGRSAAKYFGYVKQN